jgi:hypothetical protein
LVALVSLSLFVGLAATTAEAQSATSLFAAPAAAALDPPPNGAGSSNPTPTPSSTPTSSRPGTSLPLLSQDQANGLFDGFLTHGFLLATDGIRQGLQRLVNDANLVTNTSPTWTYQQSTVVALQRAVQTGANAALGLLIFWMGLNVLLHPQLGGTYTEPHEVIPRLLLGAGLANSAPRWTAMAIDVNNTICGNLLAVNSGSLGDLLGGFPVFDHTWLLGLLLVAFLLVWIWLFLKMAWRMGMLMVLLVLAPAARQLFDPVAPGPGCPSPTPCWSTARHSQWRLPRIFSATSSRCHLSPARASRRCSLAAKVAPNFVHRWRMASWLTTIPRSARRS